MGRAYTKYKTEKRKADIGERILITDAVNAFGEYDNGDVFTVEKHFYGFISEGVCVRELLKDVDGNSLQIYEEEYEVIVEEPTQASSHNENLVLTRLFNAEAEVDKLSRSIDELQRRIEALEKANEPKYVLDELTGRITDGNSHIPKLKSPTCTANQRRADVIKRAEAFVTEIESEIAVFTKVSFHVNAEKGVVTALAHARLSGKHVGKAFARCAPGDVFNASIGKAIAAGRLYGVDIPNEFLDAPQPTEFAVGQVTRLYNGKLRQVVGLEDGIARLCTGGHHRVSELNDGTELAITITDDSEAVYE